MDAPCVICNIFVKMVKKKQILFLQFFSASKKKLQMTFNDVSKKCSLF